MKTGRIFIWIFLVTGFAMVTIVNLGYTMAAKGECVVLLHGLARTARSMSRLDNALQEKGYLTSVIDYPSRTYSISQLVEKSVVKGIDKCRKKGGEKLKKIHFVTHSMGGILVRQYLATKGGLDHEQLGRVVMLAPPNHGSEIVDKLGSKWWFRWFNGPGGCSLGTGPDSVPNSLGPADYPLGIIAGNRSIDPVLSRMVAKPNDGKVSVASARLEGMQDFLVVPCGHTFIMNRPEVIKQTLRFLERGSFKR